MVDREFFEREVEGKTADQLSFWDANGAIERGFCNSLKAHRERYGEDSLASPRISVAWNFEMILRGEDVECPILKSTNTAMQDLKLEFKAYRKSIGKTPSGSA